MEKSGQLHVPPALPPGREPPGSLEDRKLGGPQSQSGHHGEESCPCRESNPSRPVLAIPTELSWLLIILMTIHFSEKEKRRLYDLGTRGASQTERGADRTERLTSTVPADGAPGVTGGRGGHHISWSGRHVPNKNPFHNRDLGSWWLQNTGTFSVHRSRERSRYVGQP
jgi:hypothetical protein